MQFDNTQKITQLQRSNVDFISDYLNSYILTSRYAKAMSCEADFDDGEYECDFILECDGFYVVLQYDSFETLSASFDVKIIYQSCDYRFSVYDIFNLFDINDFKQYYFTDCIDSTTIEKILDELTSMLEKYGVDFKKAGSGINLSRMKKNFEADQKLKNGDDWQEYLGDKERDYAQIKYMLVTASSTEKLMEKLEKHSDKLCLYERRLLDYLKSGNEFEASDMDKAAKVFKKTKMIVNIPLLFISIGAVALVQMVLNKTIFYGAFIPDTESADVLGFVLPISFRLLSLCGAAILFFAFMSMVLGRWIIIRIIPDFAKKFAQAKYAVNADASTKSTLGNRVLLPIVILLFAAIFFVGANIGIAFYDDYVVECYVPSTYEHISYDKVNFYVIENDDKGESFKDICYAVSYGDEYIVFAPCKENSKTDNKIKEIAKAHDKSITKLTYKDELAEAFENK